MPIQIEGREDPGTQLELQAGTAVPGLPGWDLERRLGARPSNELWRIRHQDSGELRVLKLALNARAERALQREVTLNQVLLQELGEPPPLVRLTAWQFEHKPAWIQMPWYAAGSLTDWVAEQGGAGRIPLQRRVRIVTEAAGARAHALGVMHKDIKPGNLLVDDSGAEPRLLMCDFGSGTVQGRERLARAGVTVMGFTQTTKADLSTTGTPAYMAPEVLYGGLYSERSDVYGLGVMLYQIVAGDLNQPLAPGWEEDIDDPGLRRIIAAACAGRPERRLASMQTLATELNAWTPDQDDPPPAPQRTPAMALSRWAGAGLTLLLTLIALWLLRPDAEPGGTLSGATGPLRVALLPFELPGVDEHSARTLAGLQNALATDLFQVSGLRLVLGRDLQAMGLAEASSRKIGEALAAERLIRGSVQQAAEALRVNMQVLDAASDNTVWAGSVEGAQASLYELQQGVGVALVAALDLDDETLTSLHRAPDPEAYAAYLTARSILRSGPYASGRLELIDTINAELNRAIMRDPEFVDARVLAISTTALAFWFFRLDRAPAEERIGTHLAALARLHAEPFKLATARAVSHYYLERDPRGGLEIMAPHQRRVTADPEAAWFYANMLRRAGRFDEAIALIQRVLRAVPGDVSHIGLLAELHVLRGDTFATQELLREVGQRLPNNPVMLHLAAMYAYFASGERRCIETCVKLSAAMPPHSGLYIEPRMELAYLDQDRVTMATLRENYTAAGSPTGGNGLTPKPLLLALALDAARAPTAEIQRQAAAALAELEARRDRSDSAWLRLSSAQALALLDRGEEALALLDEVLGAFPAERDAWEAMAMGMYGSIVLAMLGEDVRLLALIESRLQAPGNAYFCGALLHSKTFYAPVHRMPAAMVALEAGCGERIRKNREALAAWP